MCTAITYNTNNFYFGRNLDLEYSYKETISICPRNYCFSFSNGTIIKQHYAIIGVTYVVDGYPLYYDAGNEYGLCMAGLSFKDNAVYNEPDKNLNNISPFEFIPWVLTQCKNIQEVRKLLINLNLVNVPYNDDLPLTDLHWIISDREKSIVLEAVNSGLKIYENPVGILTNNPPFKYHINNLNNYINLSCNSPHNLFSDKIDLKVYSNGMGALGLPGDMSSMSRFVKAAFVKFNSCSDGSNLDDVSQFFHILQAVEQQRGCVKVGDKNEITVYSSCIDADNGVYYYKTYNNSRISAVSMYKEDLNGQELIIYPMCNTQSVHYQN